MTVQVPHSDGPDQLLCEVPFSGDRNGRCTARMLGRFPGCGPAPHTTTRVHHRGQPSLSPWKTQCAQSNQNWLNAPPWYVTVPTGCEPRKGLPARDLLCWPWRPSQATRCRPPDGPTPGRTVRCRGQPRSPRGRQRGPVRRRGPPTGLLGAPGRWRHSTSPRGPFRVQGTATPEVKFLDRCKTDSGEGVRQGPVHRSRARAWGSKRIRHPRSPAP